MEGNILLLFILLLCGLSGTITIFIFEIRKLVINGMKIVILNIWRKIRLNVSRLKIVLEIASTNNK